MQIYISASYIYLSEILWRFEQELLISETHKYIYIYVCVYVCMYVSTYCNTVLIL